MKGVVYGKGINDSNRAVSAKTYKNGSLISHWTCPKYEMWKGMLRRSLDESFKRKNPRYTDCCVCDEWLSFSTFEKWLGDIDLKGLSVDKDIKLENNKLYSPDTCSLVPRKVNNLIVSCSKARGELPVGVHAKSGRYYSQISDQSTNIQRYLGYYDNPLLAHREWQLAKIDHIRNTVEWWKSGEYSYSFDIECGNALLKRAENIQNDYDKNRETVLI